jgi:hypothetical protein
MFLKIIEQHVFNMKNPNGFAVNLLDILQENEMRTVIVIINIQEI